MLISDLILKAGDVICVKLDSLELEMERRMDKETQKTCLKATECHRRSFLSPATVQFRLVKPPSTSKFTFCSGLQSSCSLERKKERKHHRSFGEVPLGNCKYNNLNCH